MKKVTYVGPLAEVEHPEAVSRISTFTDATEPYDWVRRGDTIEVSDELAGSPPKGNPEDEDYDPGSGLLAQPSNWVNPTTKAAQTAKATAAKAAKAEKEEDASA